MSVIFVLWMIALGLAFAMAALLMIGCILKENGKKLPKFIENYGSFIVVPLMLLSMVASAVFWVLK